MEVQRRTRSMSDPHQTMEEKSVDHVELGQSPYTSGKRKKPASTEATGVLVAENTQETKEGKTEMKRRRSSFVRGRSRKSIGTTNTDVTELHTKIPTDAPAEERLRLLKLACYEYTISKLQEEFPILETKDDFRAKAKAEFDGHLQGLVDDGTLKAACYSTSRSENPVNLEMETQVSQLDREIERLEEEGKEWEKMKASLAQEAEEAARSETAAVSTKELVTLSGAQFRLLSELPDVAAISDWASENQQKVLIQIDQLAKAAKEVQKIKASVDAFISRGTRRFAQESSRGYAGIDDPRELLLKSGK